MPKLSPLVSEFRTLEEADAYDRWLRSKVIAALADRRAAIAHDKVMAEAAHTLLGGVKP
ncbi:MAG: type II toxin-antitoxin system RelB family antitoxin [Novosphingobium sp.]